MSLRALISATLAAGEEMSLAGLASLIDRPLVHVKDELERMWEGGLVICLRHSLWKLSEQGAASLNGGGRMAEPSEAERFKALMGQVEDLAAEDADPAGLERKMTPAADAMMRASRRFARPAAKPDLDSRRPVPTPDFLPAVSGWDEVRDAQLVEACLATGGFPRAAVIGGRTVWLNLHNRLWREGAPIGRAG